MDIRERVACRWNVRGNIQRGMLMGIYSGIEHK